MKNAVIDIFQWQTVKTSLPILEVRGDNLVLRYKVSVTFLT